MKANYTQFTGVALAILAANLFSSKVLLIKLAYADGASPMQVLGIRMATALPFFVALVLYSLIKRQQARPQVGDFVGMALLGLVGYYLSSVLDFHGIKYLSSGMERLLLYLYPTFLVLIRSILERTFPTRIEVMALCLAYTGTGLVYYDEQQELALNALRGSAYVLSAAFLFALYLYFSAGYIDRFGSRLYASYSSAVSCVAILIHSTVFPGGSMADLTPTILLIGILIGIFCTVIPTLALHQAISLIGSGKVSILGASGILCPLLLGIALFGEPLTGLRIGGASLVILSVVCLSWKKRPDSSEQMRCRAVKASL